ncbi:LacI family transcriptional regulator [Amycolatopsis balhimycina DSM 5908]|uniref:LacI family transcriptional regulator n=1 Tax=Amycolatopsis balhimycina DSM 5908 TaxID=1081091 RepID=A0A428W208_AMYBA|nr:LacI family DNA-binding transcriptional regulator [Amycolatopsis balhimycina]RSM37092.1 LacI family transcriptional regulator [Amycolatopsis balhimycina DSM 5908]
MKRPTITDIAKEAGVSKGAVSYALNGRPGVSEATRQRITEIARELGWAPSSTARALSGGRTGAIGLVLDRPFEVVVPALLDGFPDELLIQVAAGRDAALAVYRRWRAERKVDGVLLTEPGCAAELVRIGLPAVVLGGQGGVPGVPSVRVDDATGAAEVLQYLAALGHRRVVRVAGAAVFADPAARQRAFPAGPAHPEPSADAVRRVLAGRPRPTALVCDTDGLAVAALAAARELGLAVPRDLSVVSWDDTPLCRLVRPALTAIRRPLGELGSLAASVLHDVLAGEATGDVGASRPRLITRGSTGPAHS